jgi:hypothetical protein
VVDVVDDVAATVVDDAVRAVVVGAALVVGVGPGAAGVVVGAAVVGAAVVGAAVVGAAVVGTAVDVVAGADVVGTAVDVVSASVEGGAVSVEPVEGGAVSAGDDTGAASATTSVVVGSVGCSAAASTRLGARTVTAATINANRAWARAPTRTFIPPYLSAVGPSLDRTENQPGAHRPGSWPGSTTRAVNAQASPVLPNLPLRFTDRPAGPTIPACARGR